MSAMNDATFIPYEPCILKTKVHSCPSCVSDICDVLIPEGTGTFKYVQIRITDASGQCKTVIRGDKNAELHNDMVEPLFEKLRPYGFKVECIGGGRIFYDLERRVICVYGFSVQFGKACHDFTVKMLKRKYPLNYHITASDEGY